MHCGIHLPRPAAEGLNRKARIPVKHTKFAFVAVIGLATAIAYGKTFSIDLRNPEQGAASSRLIAASPSNGRDGVLRSFDLDAGSADVGEVAIGDELLFTLFDDVAIALTLCEKAPSTLDGDVFLAEAGGYPGVKNAVVLRTAAGLTIDVQDYLDNKVYKVVSSGAGVKVEEVEPAGRGECGCDSLVPHDAAVSCAYANVAAAQSGMPAVAASPSRLLGASATQGDDCIDILVVYDNNAAAYANSNEGGITNFAQVAVQKMNSAIANTGLDASFRFRLVGVAALTVSTNDVHEALYAIDAGRPGWAAIKDIRETVGADIVTTLIDTGSAYGTTGVGWSLSSTSSLASFASSAYNVCAVRAVAQTHTMTHECGHNLGAGHAREQSTQPGPQLYSYSAGCYFTGNNKNKYCTIMAYTGEGPGGTQIPYFSSPDCTYAGVAAGDSTRDNSRTIGNTWSHAANWRARKVPMSYDVNFEPASGALVDGSLNVVLTPGKAGTEIRYTLDGSTPSIHSPLYSGAITLHGTATIKAATVIDGVVSLPFTAKYYAKSDLGYALGLPDMDWSLSVPESSLCGVQTTNTIDGVALGAGVASGDECRFSTAIAGPATITWKQMGNGNFRLKVLSDGNELYGESWNGYTYSWETQSIDIPAGNHTVEFRLGSGGKLTYYWLDDFQVYYVRKPAFSPETTAESSTAHSFSGELMVSLVAPSDDAVLYYTLDGSDPNGEDAILYDGPFFIDDTTCVNAVAVVPGRGASAVETGYYIKHVQPVAGKWTLWGEAAYEAVASDGRMIADLCWNYSGCGWSRALEPVMTDSKFTTWAAANGVYLLADSWGDEIGATGSRYWSLYYGTSLYEELAGYTYYPTFVFAAPGDSSTCLGAMLARDDGVHKTNGRYYKGTPESLVECFASFLDDAAPLGAPVASVTDANAAGFPFAVTLTNTNATGKIYYTLDGTAPTRKNATQYNGPVTIPKSGTTLKAVVWPDGENAISGIPLVVAYESLAECVGVDELAWTNDASLPWTVKRTSSGVVVSGAKDQGLTSGKSTSTLKAEVAGPGVLRFRYKINTRGGSRFRFLVNGIERGCWSYATGEEMECEIESGNNAEFTWVYECYYYDIDSYYVCEISDISWRPACPPAAATGLSASNGDQAFGTLLRWKPAANADSYSIFRSESDSLADAVQIGTAGKCLYWDADCEAGKAHWYWVKAVNAYGESGFSSGVSGWRPATYAVFYNANGGLGSMPKQTFAQGETQALSANGFVREGFRFTGWAASPDGPVAYANGALFSPVSDVTLYAIWVECEFETGGDAEWIPKEDGSWESGKITDSQNTWITKTVIGSGKLAFKWKVSSESGYDKLVFLMDNTEQENISGWKGWLEKSYDVSGKGRHVFKWTYSKDGRVSNYDDCGWIKDVVWVPDAPSGPVVEGDDGAVVEGDADSGYTIKPGAGNKTVVVSVPDGVDAGKVTVEVSAEVETVAMPEGANIKVVSGGYDITEYISIPAPDSLGMVGIGAAGLDPVKVFAEKYAGDNEESIESVLDAARSGDSTAQATIKSAKPGLYYSMQASSDVSFPDDGAKTNTGAAALAESDTVTISKPIKPAGNAVFYRIRVSKKQ